MNLETETIDKLFLELSQITNAKTRKELLLEKVLNDVLLAWVDEANQGDGISDNHINTFNYATDLLNWPQANT